MDRRIRVIIAIVLCEAAFRIIYQAFSLTVDPLLYTLAARAVEMILILALAFDICGLKIRSIKTEALIGFGVSCAFGALVVLSDLLSRLVLSGGILKLLLSKQQVPRPWLFFLTACVFAPFVEELFFRGLFYSWLRERLPVIVSVILSALAFAGIHGFLSPIQITGGIIFAVLFEWRKSILAPYLVHAAANAGIWIVPWVYPFWGK